MRGVNRFTWNNMLLLCILTQSAYFIDHILIVQHFLCILHTERKSRGWNNCKDVAFTLNIQYEFNIFGIICTWYSHWFFTKVNIYSCLQECNKEPCRCEGIKGALGSQGPPGVGGQEGEPGDVGYDGPPGRPGELGDYGEGGMQGEKGYRVC